jgi:hypothetical protein
MPTYKFSNPDNPKDVVEISFHMNDNKEYIKDEYRNIL